MKLLIRKILFTLVLTLVPFSVYAQPTDKLYSYKQFGDQYVVSLKNHVEISKALTEFCNDQHIRAGTITGIGAVKEATLRFFNPVTKVYKDKVFAEQLEISNLTGNIAQKDGKLYLHLHITLGRADYSALAGHLLTAVINGAGEFVVTKYNGTLPRYYDQNIGLNFYQFK
ncbi:MULTISPECIES: PPC domain-containing DNA-binding protein [Commensalibacter]|uniref:PPC domain-containing protein n=2 Tax=Commensalibacter TaxID=1079922 RepID=W7DTV8_9PROT|nr:MULTISPECIES: PPC domain-containing DNA-binding protein [Commensalibacter]EUK18440.1 hypothetical protein COMX_01790 [Commensalibacter papalotli (ex Servin-Garciduenas et al. 2014)]CAI3933654.1 PPC/DUF296 domain (AF0104) (PDB:2DT4) [Commensalibacter papalotli (ex Botero et al. 2024)]CAI3942013.1 PPC/DUF296 domain (AF0104) (PDB:2DT4) [Commensalibacter papalotli (ex Botero et al. 2024)]